MSLNITDINIFDKAYEYAKQYSTCMKVKVGSACLIDNKLITACNCSTEDSKNCVKLGECYKYKVTGIYESQEETRKYCSAIHSEINLINKLKTLGFETAIPTMVLFVTRYCCENCARNIVNFGFKHIYYCGRQEISDEVKHIFKAGEVNYKWFPEYDFEYTWRDIKYWNILDIKDINKLKRYINYIDSIIKLGDRDLEYFENHHIVPNCTGLNCNDTLKLTGREHFICHKMLIDVFNGELNSKLSFAFMRMATSTNRQKKAYEVTPEEYDIAVRSYSKAYKENIEINGSPRTGKKLSDEARKRISENHADVSGENNPFYGKRHTESSKEQMHRSALLRDKSTYNTENMIKSNIGNKHASNSRWMHNETETIKVPIDKVDEFIKNG